MRSKSKYRNENWKFTAHEQVGEQGKNYEEEASQVWNILTKLTWQDSFWNQARLIRLHLVDGEGNNPIDIEYD